MIDLIALLYVFCERVKWLRPNLSLSRILSYTGLMKPTVVFILGLTWLY